MQNKHSVIVILLISLLIFSSCALVKFETPEEQRLREEQALSNAVVEKPQPEEFMTSGLSYEKSLENQAGKLLAKYTVKMPQFETDNAYSVIFERINEYFEREIASCIDDSEGFFQTVKAQYGEEWDILEVVGEPFSVVYDYQLLDTSENYICFMKTYVYYSPKGAGYTARYPDVFLAENGWRLDFDELFGSHCDPAREIVMKEIKKWCEQAGVRHEKLAELTAEDFVRDYAMDSTSLIFYAPPFMLSTNDKNSYEIKLDLSLFEGMFVDSQQN